MSDRASFEELLEFANKVRDAGGANPLDALMPAVPEVENECLIAKNLNFNCRVEGVGSKSDPKVLEAAAEEYDGDLGSWGMIVDDEETAKRISEAIGMSYGRNRKVVTICPERIIDDGWIIVLPRKIGAVAGDFDEAGREFYSLRNEVEDGNASLETALVEDLNDHDRKLLREFTPYIQVAVDEAYDLATIINEDGSIVR